jgi:hypothetical protein
MMFIDGGGGGGGSGGDSGGDSSSSAMMMSVVVAIAITFVPQNSSTRNKYLSHMRIL